MAGNNFDWTVIIRLATQGAKKSQADLMAVAAATERLGKRNKWSEQTLNSLSKGIGRAASSARSATQEFNRLQQAAQGGRNYRNASTSMDAMIAAQRREGQIFSQGLKARMEAEAKATAAKQRELDKQVKAAERARQQEIRAAQRAQQQQAALFSSPATRYALYDISRQATILAAAITGIGTAAVATAASFESAFTNVERTLDETVGAQQVEEIRQSLLDMSTEIPKSFQELSSIATLGNQLGVSEDKLVSFTDTIAKFSAISGVSAEETAKAFGSFRITLGLSEDEFENFGSAVELVGRKSAATDAEIVALTREIGQQAHQAGFTADQVVALAGTLGELRVPPERARGSLTTYFQTLNAAVAGGGKDLKAFADVLGYTAEELSDLVRNGRGVEVFQRFLANLNSQNTVEQTEALQELGLSQLRVTDTFQRLGSAAGVFNEFLYLSQDAYESNTELARQYALVVDDLASRWQIFLNSISGFGAAVGSVIGPAVVGVLDMLSGAFQKLTEFVNSGVGKGITALVAGIGALAATAAGLVGALAFGAAAMVAWNFLLERMGIAAATTGGSLWGLAGAFLGVGANATKGAVALRVFRLALISTGVGAIIVALGAVISLLVDFRGTIQSLTEPFNFVIDLFGHLAGAAIWASKTILTSFRDSFGWIPGVSAALDGLIARFQALLDADLATIQNIARAGLATFQDTAESENSAAKAGAKLGSAFNKVAEGGRKVNKELPKVANGANKAAKEVRTLVDYANDLAEVWNRAFSIRFDSEAALDKITSKFYDIADATAESERNIRSLKAEISGLQSDLNIQQQFLAVAQKYGDTTRAAAIQADIAKTQADIAAKTADLSDEQAKNSKTLKGNSKAAIANRETLRGLAQDQLDYVQALIASGASQKTVDAAIKQGKQTFIDQATQLGYNRKEVERYAAVFDDIAVAIAKVPKNVTVKANTNPALQAFNEFIDKVKKSNASVNIGANISDKDIAERGRGAGKTYAQWFNEELAKKRTITAVKDKSIPGGVRYYVTMDGKKMGNGFFKKGGYTGRGPADSPAGIVHRGEYVIPKHMVNQSTGLPYADALGRLQKGMEGRTAYQGGGYVTGSGMGGRATVDLSAFSIQQLAQVMDKFVVVNGKVVAETATNQFGSQTTNGDY